MTKLSDKLLADILSYLEKTGTAHTTLGRAATGNCRLIRNLREGRTITLDTADKLIAVMDAYPNGVRSRDLVANLPSGKRRKT